MRCRQKKKWAPKSKEKEHLSAEDVFLRFQHLLEHTEKVGLGAWREAITFAESTCAMPRQCLTC